MRGKIHLRPPCSRAPQHVLFRRHVCVVRAASPDLDPLVAVEGDMVSLHYVCKDTEGNVIDSTKDRDEPITLELGVGDIVGNPLLQGFDASVRGFGVGDEVELEILGGEYKKDLVFKVPTDHQEIQRLQGRYKSQGGLQQDQIVELANGSMAKVLEATKEHVVLDANTMLAGVKRIFQVEVVDIQRPQLDAPKSSELDS